MAGESDGLDASTERTISDLEEIRNRNHPDKTGGDFANDKQRELYLEADKKLQGLKSSNDSSALTIFQAQHRELLDVMRQSQASANAHQRAQHLNTLEAEARRSIETRARETYQPARLYSWGFAGFVGLLLALKDPLEHLAVAAHADEATIKLLAAAVAVIAAIGGFGVQAQEKREAYRQSLLLTEGGLQRFIRSPDFGKAIKCIDDQYTISLNDLVEAVTSYMGAGRVHRSPSEMLFLPYRRHGIDYPTAQHLSEVILEKLSARELMTREPGAYLSPTYCVVRGLAENLH